MLHRNMLTKHRLRTPDLNAYCARVQSSREDGRRRSDLLRQLARARRPDQETIFTPNPVVLGAKIGKAPAPRWRWRSDSGEVGLERRDSGWDHPHASATSSRLPLPLAGGSRNIGAVHEIECGRTISPGSRKAALKFHICPEADASDQVRGAAGMGALQVHGDFEPDPRRIRTLARQKGGGAWGRIRTTDTRIFNPLLYQLSYPGPGPKRRSKPPWRPPDGGEPRL